MRGLGVTALILGFFGSAWFGWGCEDPPAWRSGSVMRDSEAGRRYGIIVGIEFGAAGIGAAALGATGQEAYIAPWIAAVVGLHFFPLAPGPAALNHTCGTP